MRTKAVVENLLARCLTINAHFNQWQVAVNLKWRFGSDSISGSTHEPCMAVCTTEVSIWQSALIVCCCGVLRSSKLFGAVQEASSHRSIFLARTISGESDGLPIGECISNISQISYLEVQGDHVESLLPAKRIDAKDGPRGMATPCHRSGELVSSHQDRCAKRPRIDNPCESCKLNFCMLVGEASTAEHTSSEFDATMV
jgi:hypothetical protein